MLPNTLTNVIKLNYIVKCYQHLKCVSVATKCLAANVILRDSLKVSVVHTPCVMQIQQARNLLCNSDGN